ncbi:MAG: sulfite exporter TauE/SafE family protein [Synergistales bacterium]|nr:sulfite exporter TauE/SafE family protein [Synergistales bacterium]
MTVLQIAAVLATGVAAGFINVVAGGGSLLSLPLLVFLGLPVGIANATNRVAIICQNAVAIHHFRKSDVLSMSETLHLTWPAVLGSIVGTGIVVQIDQQLLNLVIAVLISVMALFIVFRPRMWEENIRRSWPRWMVQVVFFFIGVYGGFIQAGVGFFLIWGLVGVVGMDLVHANGAKVVIVAVYTAVSLAIFIVHGMVAWPFGLLLAVGNMTGAALGARFTVLKGNRWIRYILAAVVIVSALRMLANAL